MYSYTLILKQWSRTGYELRAIYSKDTCLIAKNQKFGHPYLHKNGKIVKGSFHYVAGSNTYPELLPKTDEVHITFTNMKYPINTDRWEEEDFKHIQIVSD